jgi:hypothetical protein
MEWNIIIPGVIVVAGWFFAHWLTSRRDLHTRKREARLKALEAAYLRIATSSNRPRTSNEEFEKVETFVSEIQLYGTPHQILLMQQIVEAFKRGEPVLFDALLADLRDTIRKQLELEPVTGPVWWLRFRRPEAATPQLSAPVSVEVGTDDDRTG